MPRYYFDIVEGDEVTSDDEGMDLEAIEAVQEEAARSLADLARDAIRKPKGVPPRLMAIDVRDNSGPVLRVAVTFTIDRHRGH